MGQEEVSEYLSRQNTWRSVNEISEGTGISTSALRKNVRAMLKWGDVERQEKELPKGATHHLEYEYKLIGDPHD